MTDYFSDFSPYVTSKGLPSPADTPYETPTFLRSKRSSRATASSCREQSATPPPLPPDVLTHDGKVSVDPRRFTPTLHASLVSEILSLRRDLESKDHLVENLEASLSAARSEAEAASLRSSEQAKEVRKAKTEAEQIEKATYEAVQDLIKERDAAVQGSEELRAKLDGVSKRTRVQDEDAARTQGIWEQEKESWERERRQLERRIHITENRLRTMVEEMTVQQAGVSPTVADAPNENETVHDSGIGHDSDSASIRSKCSPKVHRRNPSSISNRTRSLVFGSPGRGVVSPDPTIRANGFSLADELAEADEDEDLAEHSEDALPEEVLGSPASQRKSILHERQTSLSGELDLKAKRVLGLMTDDSPRSPTIQSAPAWPAAANEVRAGSPAALYVDTGYQPSPPQSPREVWHTAATIPTIEEPVPEQPTPVGSDSKTANLDRQQTTLSYASSSTQTELPSDERSKGLGHRYSLSPPSVPSITIHPPSSRPSTPRAYVLPPGTKNASAQAHVYPNMKDAGMQTEPIRIDKRVFKMPPELLLKRTSLLPSPSLPESPPASASARSSVSSKAPLSKLSITLPSGPAPQPGLASPPLQSPTDGQGLSSKDLRSLRAIPLPKPVLSPPTTATERTREGPLNRSAQYGVTRSLQSSSQLADVDIDSDVSDYYEEMSDFESKERAGSANPAHKPPPGRFGLSEPPKAVPEEKEISPIRRPHTAGGHGTTSASSSAGHRGAFQRVAQKSATKLDTRRSFRSRSPSFGSMVSSSYSTQSAFPTPTLPPYPIPLRSSSWHRQQRRKPHSDGSQSPTSYGTAEIFGSGTARTRRAGHGRQDSLRKVQSATVIRKSSPQKNRRRRRSPELTPVQSMAFESSIDSTVPIPEAQASDMRGSTSVDVDRQPVARLAARPSTNTFVSEPASSEETNLVDAIAATMVGEWMWKYVRKRKSFGLGEDNTEQSSAHIASMGLSVHGTRHKRWAWISPYERTIMWDNKQPASGPALLGKKGRKLTIRSVLDVVDDTPCPKNSDLTSAFNRSILILTPDRALKFTAVTQKRHQLWMTALSFVAESGRMPGPLPVPDDASPRRSALPKEQPPVVKRSRSPVIGRANIRDSVRMAKNRQSSLSRPGAEQQLGSGVDGALMPRALLPGRDQDEGAAFPTIPRLHNTSTARHSRKRSNTSPRLSIGTANGVRSVSSSAVSYSSRLMPTSTAASSLRTDGRSISSKSGSARESMTSPNFFEAVGTIRMEAFVDPTFQDRSRYVPAPGPSTRRRRNDINFSMYSNEKRQGFVFDDENYDPFGAF